MFGLGLSIEEVVKKGVFLRRSCTSPRCMSKKSFNESLQGISVSSAGLPRLGQLERTGNRLGEGSHVAARGFNAVVSSSGSVRGSPQQEP